jgi:tetratricopeptide (TPR) repeat protein
VVLDPKYRDALVNRGVAHEKKGALDRAIADYDEAIKLEPKDAVAVVGGLQEALADCNEALKLKPESINALDSRGFVLLRMGRYNEAINDYDAVLRIEPNKVASLYGRGMAKRRKGDDSSGNTDIAAARVIKPDVAVEFTRYGLLPPLTDAVRPDGPAGNPALGRGRHPN